MLFSEAFDSLDPGLLTFIEGQERIVFFPLFDEPLSFDREVQQTKRDELCKND